MNCIFTIIVTYNGMKWIGECLESVFRSTQKTQIIVIDNHSSDNTAQFISVNYSEIILIRSDKNLGFGMANNLAISKALEMGATHIFLMNQDTRVEPDTIQKLYDEVCSHDDIGIISPVHLTWKGDQLDFRFRTYIWSAKKEERNVNFIPLFFVNAAFWLAPANVFRKVGGFDPLFYHYGEDIDWINRCRYHGFKVGYCPNAIAYHDREYREVSREMRFHLEFVGHLALLKNINYTFYRAIIRSYGNLVKQAIRSVFLRPRDFSSYCSVLFKLIPFWKRSQHHRALCYTAGQFLDSNINNPDE